MRLLNQIILLVMVTISLSACAHVDSEKPVAVNQDKLFVHTDGTMVFRGRKVDENRVVIYQDGYGGEKAAIKLYVPLHPDFYRDTIVVERIQTDDSNKYAN